MRNASRALFGLGLLGSSVWLGCSRAEPDVGQPPTLTSGIPSTHLPPLRQRLVDEASRRVPVPLTTEQVFGALEKDGVTLDKKAQQTASPHYASYCMTAHTGAKVHLTVCEHESEERAEENVKAIRLVDRPERTIVKNGRTTLLTRRDLNNDSEAPLIDRIVHSFEQLGRQD